MMPLLLPTVLLSAITHAAPASRPVIAQGTAFDTTVAVSAASRLSLDLRTGGFIRITGGSAKVVRIHVTEGGRACGDCRVEMEQTSDGIQLRTRRATPGTSPSDLRFEIEVPNHFDVDLSSAGGEVQIEGVDGDIKGRTDSGALNLRRLSGAVDLETSRGDVTLRESYVSGRVHTVGGKVLMEDVSGTVDGTSASGRVTQRRVSRPAAQ